LAECIAEISRGFLNHPKLILVTVVQVNVEGDAELECTHLNLYQNSRCAR